ncbi:MAG: hypothetical protein QF411_09745 [Planctomycetota bacterium]|nr:hypothetical protein [Planctomycetota bacterium]
MMKTTYATNLAAATLLVVPALALGTDAGSGLRSALTDTIRAIETLSGLTEEIDQGTEDALSQVRLLTEAPILDDQARDQYLVQLRQEVGQLRMREELGLPAAKAASAAPGNAVTTRAPAPNANDAAAATTQVASNAAAAAPNTASTRTAVSNSPGQAVTTGLDDRLRLSLSGQLGQPAENKPRASESMEAQGFSADPLLEAQANYRAGRYERALALLASAAAGSEVSWWRGRCLEKLGRLSEALSSFEGVVATELNATATAAEQAAHARVLPRAQRDIEFLRWAIDFKQPITKTQDKPLSSAVGKQAGK